MLAHFVSSSEMAYAPSYPVATPDKIPKKVLEVRQQLADQGILLADLSPEKFAKATVDPKLLNVLQTGARKTMSPSVKSSYASMTAQEKNWIYQYIIDPKVANCEGLTRVTAKNEELSKTRTMWLTESQIASLAHLNNDQHASLLVKSGTLQERDHEDPPLAAAGVKQYQLHNQASWKAKHATSKNKYDLCSSVFCF